MRLLLTSNGLSNDKIKHYFVNQFDRLDDKTAALIVGRRDGERREIVDKTKKGLEELGVKVQEIDISREDIYSNYPDFDIYCVCGGNTFYILDRLRATGVQNILVEAVNKNKLFIGISAGSILAGPDIEPAKFGGDVNELGMHHLGSFHWIPFLIFPHYTEERKNAALDLKRFRFQEPVIALTDNQSLFFSDKENILVGERGGLQFCENYKLKDLTD
jgi:dipeptidase E